MVRKLLILPLACSARRNRFRYTLKLQHKEFDYRIPFLLKLRSKYTSKISSLYVCMVNIKLKYTDFVETPRKFIVAKASIRMLESSSVLIIMLGSSSVLYKGRVNLN